MKPPRALILSSLSLGTGSGLRAAYFCKALKKLGWDAELLAPAGEAKAYGLEMLASLPRFWAAACVARDLVLIVKPFPNAWSALALARWRGALTVVDIDDDDGAYRGGWLGALVRALQAPAFRVGHFFCSHHPSLREGLVQRLGATKVLELAQGVDLEVFAPRSAVPPKGPIHLVYTAHLNVASQWEVLLEAIGPWLQAHPQATLQVAGGGPSEAHFRSLASPLGSQVRFLGKVSNVQASQALAGAHCSLTAYGDNVGNASRVPMKVAESLAVGTPVVSNWIPGLNALAPYLYLADSLEPSAFGHAIDLALEAGDDRTMRGQVYVREELDWDRVATQFLVQLRSRYPLAAGFLEPRT